MKIKSIEELLREDTNLVNQYNALDDYKPISANDRRRKKNVMATLEANIRLNRSKISDCLNPMARYGVTNNKDGGTKNGK